MNKIKNPISIHTVPRHCTTPFRMIAILVDSASTSSIECVVRMALFGPFGLKCDVRRSHMSRFAEVNNKKHLIMSLEFQTTLTCRIHSSGWLVQKNQIHVSHDRNKQTQLKNFNVYHSFI